MSDRPLKLFTGNANRSLVQSIASELLMEIGKARVGRFPDGEIDVQYLENIRDSDIFIVQPMDPKDHAYFFEILAMIDAAWRASAGRIVVVLPYFGGQRQDRKDKPRVPIVAKLNANLLVAAGAERMLLVDLHAEQISGFFDIPVDTLYARPVLLRALREHLGLTPKQFAQSVVVVAPDIGAAKINRSYANRLGCSLAICDKQRVHGKKVEQLVLIGEVRDMIAVMVDDIVSTASTVDEASKLLKQHGATRLFAATAHGVLAGKAQANIQASSIERVFVTDTLAPRRSRTDKIQIVPMANLLARAIRAIHRGDSVSSLLA